MERKADQAKEFFDATLHLTFGDLEGNFSDASSQESEAVISYLVGMLTGFVRTDDLFVFDDGHATDTCILKEQTTEE